MVPEGFRWWQSYQEMQEVKDVKVAKFPSSRSSGCSRILCRSCALVRQDLVEVVLIDLGRGRSSEHVREVRNRKGNLPVMIGGQVEVWSYQARWSPMVTVADSTRNFCSLAARFEERRERRTWGTYRHGLDGQLVHEITAGSNSGDRFH
jgi:hypothetical protein